MLIEKLPLKNKYFMKIFKLWRSKYKNYSSIGCTDFSTVQLTTDVKHSIEKHWKDKLGDDTFLHDEKKEKCYVLSMFPYPSGNLHMGHVRVYAISDAMARFYRMNGKNVLHPMGWDAFGLPAENAAIQRKVPPKTWTDQNIIRMKTQLQRLGCSFDWSREIATCDPEYYKWTQKLFIKLFESNLAYQKEAYVNWDPIDKTVLADEQVDAGGRSWRSGAKVEKKKLNQWFIKTTKFAKPLLDGLNDTRLQDWKDIIKLQKHWIGDCDGYKFDLEIVENNGNKLSIWTKNPEDLRETSFIILKENHILSSNRSSKLLVKNQFSSKFPILPVIFSDKAEFPEYCDSKLGTPFNNEMDKILADSNKITYSMTQPNFEEKINVLQEATKLDLGGYPVSSKLKDWLISRQRYWGTPIPIIHCDTCGTIPVDDSQLPIKLPEFNPNSNEIPTKNKDWLTVNCHKCGNKAQRESDTMDTFVDSSWYFLRFLDPHNTNEMFSREIARKTMPVDLYIGGKEHAVLHLYYARFINHFLCSIKMVPVSEPFIRLLVQGMVMGRSFRVKATGKYVKEFEVDIQDAKKNKAIEKSTGEPVVMTWEKMSKSKLNGVDPEEVLQKYGTDTTRLIMLGDVAPTSHRNWTPATFQGILNWQNRMWLTIAEFNSLRKSIIPNSNPPNDDEFHKSDLNMFDSRNYFLAGATFNYKISHQLSVAISKMQGLTNSLRRAPKSTIMYSSQYERALATQIIMLAPMAPHFASELWSKFISTPNRLNQTTNEINWNEDVLQQSWPAVDMNYELDLSIKINDFEQHIHKIPRYKLDQITQEECEKIAFETESVISYIGGRKIRRISFVLYPGYEARLNIYLLQFQVPLKEKVKDGL